MIRRINLVKLFSQYAHFNEKSQLLLRSISTSYVCQNIRFRNSNANTERQVLDRSKTNYEDTFGNIDSFEQMFDRIKDDPEDILEYTREKKALGKSMREYIEEIKFHLDNHNYESAVKVLEVDMVNDRMRLSPYIYKVMISYNAKKGDLEEAYRLFLNFKKRKGQVTGAIYTSMFNACANCSNSLLAIKKAKAIEECIRRNEFHSINTSNYNVMLKAYGRHADLPNCLRIIDEVFERRDRITSGTFNFLFQACISDRNSGFRHALIVWRKMLQNLVKPDIFSFLLLLKCAATSSLGDVILIPDIMNEIKQESGKFFRKKVVVKKIGEEIKRKVLKIPASGDGLVTSLEKDNSESFINNKNNFIQLQSIESNNATHLTLEKGEASENCTEASQVGMDNLGNQLVNIGETRSDVIESTESLPSVESHTEKCAEHKSENDPSLAGSEPPNLLALNPTLGSVVEFGVLTEPHQRFLLLGGVKGFLKTMAEFGVEPSIKIFTSMLAVIPSTVEAEQELMSIMETYKVKLDTAFFNALMKRRLLREEDHSVKECLEKMYSLNLQPDLLTFGILAIGCRTYELGMDLLKTLRNHGYRANTEILETLLRKAEIVGDMNYVLAILRAAKEDGSDLSPAFIARVAKVVRKEQHRKKKIVEKELKEAKKFSNFD